MGDKKVTKCTSHQPNNHQEEQKRVLLATNL